MMEAITRDQFNERMQEVQRFLIATLGDASSLQVEECRSSLNGDRIFAAIWRLPNGDELFLQYRPFQDDAEYQYDEHAVMWLLMSKPWE